MKMLKLENVCKKYDRDILKDLNVEFKENRINYIYGKNGIGKTTLFKCIVGLEDFEGKIKGLPDKKEIYYIEESNPLYNNLSGLDNIKLLTSVYNKNEILIISRRIFRERYFKKESWYIFFGTKKTTFTNNTKDIAT